MSSNFGADFIVTHDKHFRVLEDIPFPKVNTIRLDGLRDLLSNFETE